MQRKPTSFQAFGPWPRGKDALVHWIEGAEKPKSRQQAALSCHSHHFSLGSGFRAPASRSLWYCLSCLWGEGSFLGLEGGVKWSFLTVRATRLITEENILGWPKPTTPKRVGKTHKLYFWWPTMACLGCFGSKISPKSLCGSLFCIFPQEMRHTNCLLGIQNKFMLKMFEPLCSMLCGQRCLTRWFDLINANTACSVLLLAY